MLIYCPTAKDVYAVPLAYADVFKPGGLQAGMALVSPCLARSVRWPELSMLSVCHDNVL